MVEVNDSAATWGVGIGLLSLGALLTLTVVGAIVGIPLAAIGAVVCYAAWKHDPDEVDETVDPTV
jgi:choline-glycine betaine transporter